MRLHRRRLNCTEYSTDGLYARTRPQGHRATDSAAINAGHLTTGDGQSHHVYKGCVIRTPCHGCAAAADATDDGDDDDADAAAAQVAAAAAAVDSQLLSASRADALTLPRTAPVFALDALA